MTIDAADVVACDQCGTKNRVPKSSRGVPRCGRCHAALAWITDAGDDDFDAVARGASLGVLIDLWAEWCGPCKTVSPILRQLAHRFAGRLKVVQVNVDQAPAVARRFGVQSIPMLAFLRNGEVVAQRIGAAPASALEDWLVSLLGESGA